MLVMIVDDHPILRRTVVNDLLAIRPEIKTVEQNDLRATVAALKAGTVPDLLLLDLNLPDAKGIGAVRAIASIYPIERIVAFSGEEDRELVIAVHERGALGFVLKSSSTTLEQFRTVLSGQRSFPPLPKRDAEAPFTRLELEVLKFIGSSTTPGSAQDIATYLKVPVRTATRVVQSLRKKLGATSRAQAVAKARKLGLLRDYNDNTDPMSDMTTKS